MASKTKGMDSFGTAIGPFRELDQVESVLGRTRSRIESYRQGYNNLIFEEFEE